MAAFGAKAEQTKQEETQVKQEGTGTTATMEAPKPEAPAMDVQAPREARAATRRFNRGANDPTWFLSRDGELEVVTDEDTNPALGIIKIYARAATDAQFNNGIIANVSLDTVLGRIEGFQIRESKERDGNIQLSEPSSSYMSGTQKKYNNYTKLLNPVKAQILSHVWSQLSPAE